MWHQDLLKIPQRNKDVSEDVAGTDEDVLEDVVNELSWEEYWW